MSRIPLVFLLLTSQRTVSDPFLSLDSTTPPSLTQRTPTTAPSRMLSPPTTTQRPKSRTPPTLSPDPSTTPNLKLPIPLIERLEMPSVDSPSPFNEELPVLRPLVKTLPPPLAQPTTTRRIRFLEESIKLDEQSTTLPMTPLE